ncbi:RNA polymerase sigma factor RpoE [Labilithrix luteola]|uniref:RNA polymerase sigma factor RpoE n=1 Tax=Labilithrix luteola TaxID=1391654 RepID=A0A0K1Q354_9BACT|nr:RNA polymerase sigma factor RpoE [Labilithrix luteola]
MAVCRSESASASAPASHTGLATDMFREHGRYAFRLLRRLGVEEADVDDVLQEVFVVVHRKLPDFDPRGSRRAWLYGICIRLAADYRRRQRKRRELRVDQVDEPIDPSAATPLELLEARKTCAVLDGMLSELPDQKREVFVLHVIEDLPMAEVAEVLGCPLHTAYTRYYAARKLFEAAARRARAQMSLP